jgi:hypothetical protein
MEADLTRSTKDMSVVEAGKSGIESELGKLGYR